MNIGKDLAHLAKIARYGFKTLPSRVTDKQRQQGMMEFASRRALAMRPKNYYQGAESGVFRGDWMQTVTSATSVIRQEYRQLCARSELAYRTDAWARRAMQVLATFVVGQGIKPYPIIKMANGEIAEISTSKLAQDWQRFNDQGIRNGSQQITVYEAQRLEFLTIGVYGNTLCNVVSSKPGSWLRYAFQFIKPTRLDFGKDNYFDDVKFNTETGNKIVHGIEINSFGEPVRFYIDGVEKPVDASRMNINYYPIETEMYMGLPWSTPSLGNIWDNQQIFEDKMKQSRIAARLGMRIEPDDEDAFRTAATSSKNGEDYIDLDFQGLVSAKDGSLTAIKMDDTIRESFTPLIKHNLIQLSAGMGYSYQVLSSDLEGMNFAASRANIINDNRWFRAIYKWYTKTVLQRRWEKFVEWEILQGKVPGVTYQNFIDDPWYYTQCYWLPMDGEEWVDPLKDAESIKLLYGLGQITYQEICAMAGKDYKSTYAQLKKERDMFAADKMEHLLPNYQPDTSARREKLMEPSKEDE